MPTTDKPAFDLRGRTALVTGSSRGIGAAIARRLATSGADVAIHCASGEAAARETADLCAGSGVRSFVVRGDLAAPDGPRSVHGEALARLGRIDILVLNASVQIRRDWRAIPPEEAELHYAVNFRASLELLQRCVPAMQERRWGRVLTIGSVQERRPHPDMLVYSSLKHAQTGLVLGLARQLAPHGVTINNLAPGVILTDRNRTALSDEAYAERVRTAIPAGYFGQPEDCSGAALLLCSEEGRYITGQSLHVDGGFGLA